MKEVGTQDSVTDRTLFQAGSVSKPIFAMAVMRLAQDGQLDLEKDVNSYLISWKVPPSEGWQPVVTLRQILSHSAGMTAHGFAGYLRYVRPHRSEGTWAGARPQARARELGVDVHFEKALELDRLIDYCRRAGVAS